MNKNNNSSKEDKTKFGKAFKAGVAGTATAGLAAGAIAAEMINEEENDNLTDDEELLTKEQEVEEEDNLEDVVDVEEEIEDIQDSEEAPEITEQEEQEIVSAEEPTEEQPVLDDVVEQPTEEVAEQPEPSINSSEIVGTDVEFTNETAPTEHEISNDGIIGQQIDINPEDSPFKDGVAFTEYAEEEQPVAQDEFAESTPEEEPTINTNQVVTGDEYVADIHQTSSDINNATISGEQINVYPDNNPFADGVAFTEYVDDATISETPDFYADAVDSVEATSEDEDFFNESSIIDKIIAGEFIDPMDAEVETDAVLTYGEVETAYNDDGSVVSSVEVQNEGVNMMMYDTDGDNVFDLMVDDANRTHYDVTAWNISVGDAQIYSDANDMGYISSDIETPDAFNPDMNDDLIDPSMV